MKKYQKPEIDLIAITNGPGLEPALWVGVNFAKALACFWDLQVMPVNHVEAHITANWLDHKPCAISHKLIFPAISLIVSGGHTQLVLMRGFGKYEILGETRDDAAGEAFDKLAKMLNLGYPGGPIVAAYAAKLKVKSEKLKVKLPRPMINSKDYDFSFSGLKTAVLYKIKELKTINHKLKTELCHEFQRAVIDVLVSKTIRAAREYKAKTVILGGGVAANAGLRAKLEKETIKTGAKLLLPEIKFTGDNAAMIALPAYFRFLKHKKIGDGQGLIADSNLKLK